MQADYAEELREATLTAVEEILEMDGNSKDPEELAEVAREDTPEDAAVKVKDTELEDSLDLSFL